MKRGEEKVEGQKEKKVKEQKEKEEREEEAVVMTYTQSCWTGFVDYCVKIITSHCVLTILAS